MKNSIKTILWIVVILSAITINIFSATAQNNNKNSWFVEFYVLALDKQEIVPTANIYTNHKINDSWSITSFALTTNTWGELYGGFEYTPAPWLVMGLSVGIETNSPEYWRTAATLLFLSEKVDFTNFFEYGGSGYWFDIQLKYKPTSWCKIGLIARRFHGAGIRADFSIPKTPFAFWIAPLYNQGEILGGPEKGVFGGITGIYFKF